MADMAHRIEPEPRWRLVTGMFFGMLAEIVVLLFAVAVVLAIAGLNS